MYKIKIKIFTIFNQQNFQIYHFILIQTIGGAITLNAECTGDLAF